MPGPTSNTLALLLQLLLLVVLPPPRRCCSCRHQASVLHLLQLPAEVLPCPRTVPQTTLLSILGGRTPKQTRAEGQVREQRCSRIAGCGGRGGVSIKRRWCCRRKALAAARHTCAARPPGLLLAGLCHCRRTRSALAAAQPQLRLRATHTSALACLSPSPRVPQVMFNGARITKGVKRQIGFVLQVRAASGLLRRMTSSAA